MQVEEDDFDPLDELYPSDFDEFDENPVWRRLQHEIKIRRQILKQVRDDPRSKDSIIRSAIARLQGLEEAQNVYNALRDAVIAGEQMDKVMARQASTEGMTELERLLNEAHGNIGDVNNGTDASSRRNHDQHVRTPGHGTRRRYLPG